MSKFKLRFLASLALIILLGSMLAMAEQASLDSYEGCGLLGTAKSQCGQELNTLKNRYRSPTSDAINHAITLEAILKTGDDLKRWDTKDAAEIVGYVALVEPGGYKESCNCADEDLQDIHINIVSDPKYKYKESRFVVAEITPRLQYLNPAWTYDNIRKLEGKWVKFTGWMLFDTMHSRESYNTRNRAHQECGNLKRKSIWRATGWEIHPVTSFVVVPAP